jgi:hypothetical protein
MHDRTDNERAHASVISRRRRIVLCTQVVSDRASGWRREEGAHLRTVAAAVVDTVHAPPAMTLRHAPQFQMPTAERFTLSCVRDHREHARARAGGGQTDLAAEGAGVACVLGDFHLHSAGSAEHSACHGRERTFLTCLRRDAP